MIRIRAAALGAALAFGAATSASAQTTTPPRAEAQRGASADQARARGARPRHRAARQQLFRGIQLTSVQQTRLRATRGRYQQERERLRASMRPALEQARAARQRGDTAAARAALQGTASQRTQLLALRERELSELRAVLTPAQQSTLDANAAALRKRRGERGRGEHAGRRGMTEGRSAPRDTASGEPGTM